MHYFLEGFFNRLGKFSFKDLLASIFTVFFFYCGVKAIGNKDALEVLKTLVSLEGVILSFYFITEGGTAVANMYFQRSQQMPPPSQSVQEQRVYQPQPLYQNQQYNSPVTQQTQVVTNIAPNSGI